MKPSSLKAKGRNHQKEVAAMIEEIFDLQSGEVKWCSMGASGEDIQLSPYARKLLPFSVECKKQRKHPGVKEMNQSRFHVKDSPGIIATVCWSPHRSGIEEAMMTLNLREFLTSIKQKYDRMNAWLNSICKECKGSGHQRAFTSRPCNVCFGNRWDQELFQQIEKEYK